MVRYEWVKGRIVEARGEQSMVGKGSLGEWRGR